MLDLSEDDFFPTSQSMEVNIQLYTRPGKWPEWYLNSVHFFLTDGGVNNIKLLCGFQNLLHSREEIQYFLKSSPIHYLEVTHTNMHFSLLLSKILANRISVCRH